MRFLKQSISGGIGLGHQEFLSLLTSTKIIKRHEEAILATMKNGLSNARIEAINNKIKLSIRMAYGFRNIENLFSTIMLHCGCLVVKLPGL